MARPKSVASLTIAELERILKERRGLIPKLHKQRKWILKQLAALESKISSLAGHKRGRKPGRKPGRGPGRPRKLGGRRPKNSMSLVESIHGVLSHSGTAMKVGDIMDAVKKSGY